MFCSKCGNELSDGAKFCSKCGERTRSVALGADRIAYTDSKGKQKDAGGRRKTIDFHFVNVVKKKGLDYIGIWRNCKNLGKKEAYLWFGIHGGIVLLLLCIILIPMISGGTDSKGTIKKAFEQAGTDGEIGEEEIARLARMIGDYEDVRVMREVVEALSDTADHMILYENAFSDVLQESKRMSALGMAVEEYSAWYDQDGLTMKLFECQEQPEYLYLSFGSVMPVWDSDRYVDESVEWFAYAGSGEITFIKTIYEESGAIEEQYNGRIEVLETEILVTLDGEQYHLSEASTDIETQMANSFYNIAKGKWRYSEAIYNVFDSGLGGWEDMSGFGNPACIDFFPPSGGIVVINDVGAYINWISCDCEQGEGNTVMFRAKNGSELLLSYRKEDGDLILTANGNDYVLSPTAVSTGNNVFGYFE